MHLPSLSLTLLSLMTATAAARNPPSSSAILLSNVKALTLRKDLKTTHNRVSAIPQLTCIGGNAADLHQIDVMRCKNQGADYDDENVQWTCTANLPSEFKLGSTDVICEGFSSSNDLYVLKGSCGVEYRLLLTKTGEEKYGRSGGNLWSGYRGPGYINWPAIIFWALFIAVVGWMLYSAFIKPRLDGTGGGSGSPWGGGGGGGGLDGDDAPPPYSRAPPPPHSKASSSQAPGAAPAPAQQGWRPGFWTGTLGGAAAGYMAGNRQNQTRNNQRWGGNTGGYFGNDNGEGSSGWGGGRTRSSGSGSSSFSSTRYESSGFGGTSRR